MTILFSSAGRRVELLDCFRQAGAELGVPLRILAVDANPSLSAACQRAERSFQVPRCGVPDFVDQLLAICAGESVSLVIPTIDPELGPLAANLDRFRKGGTLVSVSSPEVVAIARNKLETQHFLSALNICTPRTALAEEFLGSIGDWQFPIILKPIAGSSSIGVKRVNSPDQLNSLKLESEYIVQELWFGKEYTVNLFFDSSGMHCAIPHRRLEVRAGEVSKGITERVSQLGQVAERLGQALAGNAFGVLCFQAIVKETGETAVFEINARFGGGYPLAHRAGANFAKWLLEIASGRSCSANNGWRENVLMLRHDSSLFPTAAVPI